MNDITAFVAVHDMDIIVEAEQDGRFDAIPNLTWLFLGPRPGHPDETNWSLIRCTDYEPDMPNLYDFAGFDVLVKHNLIRTPYSIFLQYDHEVLGDLSGDAVRMALQDSPSMVSCVPAGYDPNNWMLQVSDFRERFHEALRACGVHEDWSTLNTAVWPTTQGHAWRSSYFYTFINWARPGLHAVADYQYAGHVAERLLTVFCARTHPAQYATGLFLHMSKDVHGTGALMGGDVATFNERNAVFGK